VVAPNGYTVPGWYNLLVLVVSTVGQQGASHGRSAADKKSIGFNLSLITASIQYQALTDIFRSYIYGHFPTNKSM